MLVRLRSSAVGLLFLFFCVEQSACTPDCRPASGETRANVILVTVDTLRADHIGAYGNPHIQTPALDQLASEGAVFETCYAQSNVTVPSHLTILSSLSTMDHGVLGNGGPLPDPVLTLPQIFADAGYRTAAIVSAKHLGPEFAVGSSLTALDYYHAPRRLSEPAAADETNTHLFRWMGSSCAEPFFIWVHYWDPHMPYAPPGDFDRMYYDGDPYDERHTSMHGVTQAWHHYERRPLGALLETHRDEVQALQDTLDVDRTTLKELILERQDLARYTSDPGEAAALRARLDGLAQLIRANLPLQPGLAAWLTQVRDLKFPQAQYAGEVSYVDQAVGALRAELERLGIADRTIVIITGDHGESLGEHGIYFGHAGMYDTTLRVPLLMWAPGRIGVGRHSDIVSGLDVAPTILHLAGLPLPPTMQGRNVFADPDPGAEATVVSVANHGRQIMMREGRWKLVRTLESFYYVDGFAPRAGDIELYDLQVDPHELVNLATRRADIVARLGTQLDSWLAERTTNGRPGRGSGGGTPRLSREQRDGLRALGYVE
jgi:arylsulfatase A-like enzyme